MMVHDNVPFVSVVIPTYNRRELLRGAIESLLNQSYPDDRYEIIVVDNSSTDGTEETVRSLQEKSQKVLRYYRKKNEGPGSARNLGIEKAKGTVVAFTDSDCVADKNWLDGGVANMTDGVGIVQGKTLPNPDQPQRKLQQTMKVLSEDSYYQTCNIFYRKEILDSVGGFSPELCGLDFLGRPRWGGEDADLAWRIKKQGWRSVFADIAVVYHHVFPVTTPGEFIRAIHLSIIFTLAQLLRKHPEMRDSILYRKIFKSKQRALFYILMLSLAAGIFVHWGFLVLGVPYIIRLIKVSFHRRPIWSYHRGLALFCIIFIVELVESVLSICASLIYRTVIL
jgi:glycosyltransferase involved in cell wall biosynthesis